MAYEPPIELSPNGKLVSFRHAAAAAPGDDSEPDRRPFNLEIFEASSLFSMFRAVDLGPEHKLALIL